MTPDGKFFARIDEMCERLVEPGAHVHFASTMSRPNVLALVFSKVFRDRARFVVSSNALHASLHALTIAGLVERAIICFAGDTVPSPRPNPLYRRIQVGDPFLAEEWSILSLLQRLIAGATGAPYTSTTSLRGSDLPTNASITDTGVIPALRPDVTMMHAHCADTKGNLYLAGPVGEGWWGAMAARQGVIATVEAVVATPPKDGVACSIPASRVLGICHTPYGAHPQGLSALPSAGVKGYLDDYAFQEETGRACRASSDAKDWLATWATASHTEYLDQLGSRRLDSLQLPSSHLPGTPDADRAEPISRRELHVILAARAVVRRSRTRDYGVLLAGIGAAHLSAWLAARLLRSQGAEIQVVAELGLIDFLPTSGDVHLFSQHHVRECRQLAGTHEVLGGLIAGGAGRTLGVLSAGQVDELGRLNSSRAADGGFLIGSGGANDIASHVDVVAVVPASQRRYPRGVSFVTAPGENVNSVVSEYGCFARSETSGRFELTTCVDGIRPAEFVKDRTGWNTTLATDLLVEPPVTVEELSLLRSLDPTGVYRRPT
ncbi:CoA-transferase [Nonomuraea sp. NPDC050540]|uniref:CoA-transferase n=1 Tax=Nonomuraea sp. NPDC050540 TaxID=3364367 RepID=UPI0037A34279